MTIEQIAAHIDAARSRGCVRYRYEESGCVLEVELGPQASPRADSPNEEQRFEEETRKRREMALRSGGYAPMALGKR